MKKEEQNYKTSICKYICSFLKQVSIAFWKIHVCYLVIGFSIILWKVKFWTKPLRRKTSKECPTCLQITYANQFHVT